MAGRFSMGSEAQASVFGNLAVDPILQLLFRHQDSAADPDDRKILPMYQLIGGRPGNPQHFSGFLNGQNHFLCHAAFLLDKTGKRDRMKACQRISNGTY